jgi:SAM-dependent methyltransferase
VSFHHGDLEALPFRDEHVDIVTGFNSFQYAADPRHALTEARRVTRRGGHVIIATWGMPHACEAAACIAALKPLLPPPPPGASGPFSLSDEVALRTLVASANLTWCSLSDVEVTWQFPDADAALAAVVSAGPATLAVRTSGRDAVTTALRLAIAPYRLANGAYRLENQFRFAIAVRD